MGRRERNKQQKRTRIVAAADELFDRYGVDAVTTQQIAEAADIGVGTLFLYARTKAELLLLVQNARYAEAVERGSAAASGAASPVGAVMALVEPVVACNRRHADNGRAYIRELLFGDPGDPHRRAGLDTLERVEQAYAALLRQHPAFSGREERLARTVTAVMVTSLVTPEHREATDQQVLEDVRGQVEALLA